MATGQPGSPGQCAVTPVEMEYSTVVGHVTIRRLRMVAYHVLDQTSRTSPANSGIVPVCGTHQTNYPSLTMCISLVLITLSRAREL